MLVGGDLIAGEVTPDLFYAFLDALDAHGLEVIVYEGFRVRNLNALIGDRIVTIEVIGVIKDWARRHGVPAVEQLPAMKQGWDNKQLRHHLIARLPNSGHAIDAIRHLAHYMGRNKRLEELRNATLRF
jgi:hypothetical protein